MFTRKDHQGDVPELPPALSSVPLVPNGSGAAETARRRPRPASSSPSPAVPLPTNWVGTAMPITCASPGRLAHAVVVRTAAGQIQQMSGSIENDASGAAATHRPCPDPVWWRAWRWERHASTAGGPAEFEVALCDAVMAIAEIQRGDPLVQWPTCPRCHDALVGLRTDPR